MKQIEVRQARFSERQTILDFIRDQWNPNHVFVTCPQLFDWQYKQEETYNIIIAILKDGETITVLGILGYIPICRYDSNLQSNDIFLAVWKTHEKLSPPGLGLRLLKYIQSELEPDLIGAIGISDYVKPIYTLLGYEVSGLRQYAFFNADYGQAKIARNVPETAYMHRDVSSDTNVLKITQGNLAEHAEVINTISHMHRPNKSAEYISNRYLKHPWYDYAVFSCFEAGEIKAVIIWRGVKANGSHILRIVDVIGNQTVLSELHEPLQNMLSDENAEYIDIMCSGMDEQTLKSGGFISQNEYDELVLPNYFSPFVQENIVIDLAYKNLTNKQDEVILFRADSDQDRPNNADELK